AAATAGAAAGGAATRRERRELLEPEPTQAMEVQDATRPIAVDDAETRALDTTDDTDTRVLGMTGDAETRALDTADGGAGATRVLDEQPRERTGRFGIIRDEVPDSAIPAAGDTGGAGAGASPIVLVEEPVPPRRKGARGVGAAVVLLATLIFALLLAAASFAVGYLFDRGFDATETLETLWLRPSFLLPVIVFLVAYLVLALIVNRAGWWAHVLGGFLVAALVYLAHIAGAFMESEGGWEGYTALPGIDAGDLAPLLLAPLSVLAFVIAREVPIWVGGIVSRRGRRAREWNRQAMDDFNAENTERLAAYERARS
ncbi:hypothetical protein, partial [Agrococcus sp. HG114]|uniref:hypothetical protein n=1 Tax=Agrococcus sp. HG114 TaxID=2969757 RepID=UPI00215AA608